MSSLTSAGNKKDFFAVFLSKLDMFLVVLYSYSSKTFKIVFIFLDRDVNGEDIQHLTDRGFDFRRTIETD